MADQQQYSAPGRLFQNFEQCVCAFSVEFVDRIHDRNPPSPLPGGRTEESDRPANVIDLNVLAQLVGLLVDRAFEHQKVAVPLCRDAPGDRMIGIDVKRRRSLYRRRAWIGMGKDEARHAVGERRLADPGRSRDQPRVVEAPTLIGFEQRALGLSLAMEDGGLAWRPRLDALGIGIAHEAAPARRTGALTGSSRSLTLFQMRSATASFGSAASVNRHRPGSSVASA